MDQQQIKQLIEKQRSWFFTGATLKIERRIQALNKLKACIIKHESEINEALCKDLGKSPFESYMCETGLVLSEITYMIKHIRQFATDRMVPTPPPGPILLP